VIYFAHLFVSLEKLEPKWSENTLLYCESRTVKSHQRAGTLNNL
jgi:hypothetical protein